MSTNLCYFEYHFLSSFSQAPVETRDLHIRQFLCLLFLCPASSQLPAGLHRGWQNKMLLFIQPKKTRKL